MSDEVRHLFAEATALLEDLHGLTVEGQGTEVPSEVQHALCRDMQAGIRRMARLVALIGCAASDCPDDR